MVGFDLDPELSLALRTSHDSQYFSESSGSSEQHATSTREERCTGKASEKRTITIFYDGRMCTSNVTEIQAKTIISMAEREIQKGGSKEMKPTNVYTHKFLIDTKRNIGSFQDQPQFLSNSSEVLNQGLSMKQSLQRFLQKRKTRIASASPYIRPNCCSLRR